MPSLLAVDIGLRTGLALYDRSGKLRWYRSQNFGSAPRLRRAVRSLLVEIPDLEHLLLEGGGALADIWEREALKCEIDCLRIHAETWRRELLLQREQRSGKQAKESALALAREVVAWSGLGGPTALRHDAAEAILVGLWGVLRHRWLERLPAGWKRPPP